MADITINEALTKFSKSFKEYADKNYLSKDEKSVFNADTHFDFPSVGKIDVIYKAYSEKKVYQWNDEKLTYEPLNENTEEMDSIKIINGGNANGN